MTDEFTQYIKVLGAEIEEAKRRIRDIEADLARVIREMKALGERMERRYGKNPFNPETTQETARLN